MSEEEITHSSQLAKMDAEDFCLWWRREHPWAYLALGEGCGLALNLDGTAIETEPQDRSPERTEAIFEALKTLVEIDPDGRR